MKGKPSPKWHVIKMLRAQCPDGYYRAVLEAAEDLVCNRCEQPIAKGKHFTRREGKAPILVTSKPSIKYDSHRYPVCRKCCPFVEINTWEKKRVDAL